MLGKKLTKNEKEQLKIITQIKKKKIKHDVIEKKLDSLKEEINKMKMKLINGKVQAVPEQQPIQEPIKQQMQQPIQEPIKQQMQQPIQEPVQRPIMQQQTPIRNLEEDMYNDPVNPFEGFKHAAEEQQLNNVKYNNVTQEQQLNNIQYEDAIQEQQINEKESIVVHLMLSTGDIPIQTNEKEIESLLHYLNECMENNKIIAIDKIVVSGQNILYYYIE